MSLRVVLFCVLALGLAGCGGGGLSGARGGNDWTVRLSEDLLVDAQEGVAATQAQSGINYEFPPGLLVRCEDGEFEIRIRWNERITSRPVDRIYLLARIDENEVHEHEWTLSNNGGTSVLAERSFAESLMAGSRLVVHVPPENFEGEADNPASFYGITAVFSLAGSTNAIRPVLAACSN